MNVLSAAPRESVHSWHLFNGSSSDPFNYHVPLDFQTSTTVLGGLFLIFCILVCGVVCYCCRGRRREASQSVASPSNAVGAPVLMGSSYGAGAIGQPQGGVQMSSVGASPAPAAADVPGQPQAPPGYIIAPAGSPWQREYDPSTQAYYYHNTKSGESSWLVPSNWFPDDVGAAPPSPLAGGGGRASMAMGQGVALIPDAPQMMDAHAQQPYDAGQDGGVIINVAPMDAPPMDPAAGAPPAYEPVEVIGAPAPDAPPL